MRRLLLDVAAGRRAARRRPAIHFTPHDFRRLFATEMVSTGLPRHIATTLPGAVISCQAASRRRWPEVGAVADQAQRVAVVADLQSSVGGDLDDELRLHLD
ncbi:hypothetical protein [Kribbella sp. ALI-6-A]|uniref:hypothetical protein n=1 Tax=Kribbella sp. ALI-6-A TaxID=1933817 RepID=UPI00117B4C26|nr:hypothetical protein [Kribbella sp. ALI-6-A]